MGIMQSTSSGGPNTNKYIYIIIISLFIYKSMAGVTLLKRTQKDCKRKNTMNIV